MTLIEKLQEEKKLLDQIAEAKRQVKVTKSPMRKEQLLRHIHKLENKWRKNFG